METHTIARTAPFDRQHFRRLTPEQLDSLPYGVIVLDRAGTILEFNEAEARAVRMRREHVVGKNFFLDVAPCSKVREFRGRFEAFVDGERTSVEAFEFFFPFVHGTQHVTILFIREPESMDRVSIILMRCDSDLIR